jgi:hypothetical protein
MRRNLIFFKSISVTVNIISINGRAPGRKMITIPPLSSNTSICCKKEIHGNHEKACSRKQVITLKYGDDNG